MPLTQIESSNTGADGSDAAREQQNRKRLRRLNAELAFLSVLAASVGGLGMYLNSITNCDYGSAAECLNRNRERCGTDIVTEKEKCEEFVTVNEECYCSACRLCMTRTERAICDQSAENRIAYCQNTV